MRPEPPKDWPPKDWNNIKGGIGGPSGFFAVMGCVAIVVFIIWLCLRSLNA